MARRSRSRFVRPPARTVMWIGAGIGSASIVASADALISSLSAGALLLRPFTVMRTRMMIGFSSDQIAVQERPQGTYGKIVVTETAAALGTTAIPDPSTVDGDPEASWFVSQDVMNQFEFSTAAAWQSAAENQYTVDSKAMRKVGPDDDIVGMFSETGGFGAILTTRGRMLIQLH